MAKLKYKAFLLASIRLHRRLIESLVTLRLYSQDFYFQGYISMSHVFFQCSLSTLTMMQKSCLHMTMTKFEQNQCCRQMIMSFAKQAPPRFLQQILLRSSAIYCFHGFCILSLNCFRPFRQRLAANREEKGGKNHRNVNAQQRSGNMAKQTTSNPTTTCK